HTTARALRRNLASDADEFPQDVVELMDYFAGSSRRQVLAVPGAGLDVPLWILGSSLFGAQLAAHLGLPYAFASHFAPQMMMQAIDMYRSNFRPSAQLAEPYVMLGFNVFAADTDEEAHLLATSMQQAFVALRTGNPGKLKPPVSGYLEALDTPERMMLDSVLACSAIGSRDTVAAQLHAFIDKAKPDEMMITSQIYDHAARLHAYEITADIRRNS
ncbi:MAG: MsnO8 family LLM class oxidoreductase, partial [Massilia sp.]